jgi:broad specificity phosphatase PhoE
MPTVLLVRHGQASFGAENYDVLSDVGVRQAGLVAASLAERGYEPTRLVSGSLQRQRETAAAFAGHGAEPEVDERWNEFDPDDVLTHHSATSVRLQGPREEADGPLTTRAFQAVLEPALADWIEMAEGSPANQSWTDFSGAGTASLAEIAGGLESGQTAVVVTSGGAIAALVGGLMGGPAPIFTALNRILVNAAVTKLVIGSTGTNVMSFNDHSHLELVDRSLVTYR